MTQMALFGEPEGAREPKAVKGPLEKPAAPQGWLRHKARNCGSCGAPIVFALETKKHRGEEITKPRPFDLEPDPGGTTHLVVEGRTVRAFLIPKKDRGGRNTLHQSHFKTCPQAEQWRRGEAPNEPRE